MMDASSVSHPDEGFTHRHERPPLRVNPIDRWILRGRDPWQPVVLLRFERLRWALIGAVLLAVIGAGVISWAGQQNAKRICRARNANSVIYRTHLDTLALAADERGDKRSAAVFRALRPPSNLPPC